MAEAKDKKKPQMNASGGGGGAVYFFGMIGSLVYFVNEASGFGEVVVAFLKALVWPAFLVYDLLQFIGA